MLKSNLALEVSLSDETMIIDNRELYLSWYPSFGEVRIGKQINSWGVGSTNSPLDILTPVNYYYFFSQGIEKNIGMMSLAIDGYFTDYKLGLVYLFEHKPHYLPLDDPEMPITIDSLPENEEFKIRIPLKRYGKTSEISEVVSILTSDGAVYITGQNIRLDGRITKSV